MKTLLTLTALLLLNIANAQQQVNLNCLSFKIPADWVKGNSDLKHELVYNETDTILFYSQGGLMPNILCKEQLHENFFFAEKQLYRTDYVKMEPPLAIGTKVDSVAMANYQASLLEVDSLIAYYTAKNEHIIAENDSLRQVQTQMEQAAARRDTMHDVYELQLKELCNTTDIQTSYACVYVYPNNTFDFWCNYSYDFGEVRNPINYVFYANEISEATLTSFIQHFNPNYNQPKRIKATFVAANVLEGAGTYVFETNAGQRISFVFDDYYQQNIGFNFFTDDALTNPYYVGLPFNINYYNQQEIRGESEEPQLVNRIVSIRQLR